MTDYRPKGPFGVLLTPFRQSGDIDFEVFDKEVEFVASSEIAGMFPCATTGEFIRISPDNNIELLRRTAQLVGDRKQLAAGACSADIDTTIKYMKKAAEYGYDCAVVCVPYYITMGQEDVYEFYKRIARENIIPIVLYNIPMFTGEISIHTFERLLSEENIIGIKDSSANMKRIAHLADLARRERPDFSILSGTDDCLVPALTAGCCGSMTAFSTIFPEMNALIYKKFAEGNIQVAQAINVAYLRLLRLADSIAFPAGYKLLMEMRGFSMGEKAIVHQIGTEAYSRLIEEIKLELATLYHE